MKININYDLMDKISESKKGYSLKRYTKRTLLTFSIASIIDISFFDNDYNILIYKIISYITFHSLYNGISAYALSDLTKKVATNDLSQLIHKLNNLGIKTDETVLLDSHSYKTTYDINLDSNIPQIKQNKYINIPIKDEYWGNKEISLLQEHIIGTKEYELSIGKPEEKKIYILGYKTTKGV